MRSSLELAARTALEFRQSIPGFPQKLLRPQLPWGGCCPAAVSLPTSSLLEMHPSQRACWQLTELAPQTALSVSLLLFLRNQVSVDRACRSLGGRWTFLKCYLWCGQTLAFWKWELGNVCIVITAVLKVCSMGSLESPRPFQGFHEVKTIFIMARRRYLPFLPPLQ